MSSKEFSWHPMPYEPVTFNGEITDEMRSEMEDEKSLLPLMNRQELIDSLKKHNNVGEIC